MTTELDYVYSLESALITPAQHQKAENKPAIRLVYSQEALLESLGIITDKTGKRWKLLIDAIDDYASQGYDLANARASLALLAQSILNPVSARFTVLACTLCENGKQPKGSTARPIIKLSCDVGGTIITHEEKTRKYPVQALAHAFKAVLSHIDPSLEHIHIEKEQKRDFGCGGRYPITLRFFDAQPGLRWKTQGSSPNALDAHIKALTAGYTFRLDPRYKAVAQNLATASNAEKQVTRGGFLPTPPLAASRCTLEK